VLVDAALPDEIDKTLASLEDRRLWSGDIPAVHQVVWGPPGQTWTARQDKDQNTWKITGPDQAATQQNSVRLEMALWNFQNLEGAPMPPRAGIPTGPPTFVLELLDQAGKPLLHLEEVGALGKTALQVITRVGDKTETALVPTAPFRQWQEEMHRLTVTARKAGKSQEKGESGQGARSKSDDLGGRLKHQWRARRPASPIIRAVGRPSLAASGRWPDFPSRSQACLGNASVAQTPLWRIA